MTLTLSFASQKSAWNSRAAALYMTFNKKDVKSIGMNVDDVKDSIMTCVKALVPAIFGKKTNCLILPPCTSEAYGQLSWYSAHGTESTVTVYF